MVPKPTNGSFRTDSNAHSDLEGLQRRHPRTSLEEGLQQPTRIGAASTLHNRLRAIEGDLCHQEGGIGFLRTPGIDRYESDQSLSVSERELDLCHFLLR